jgi:hypothetical protein
MTYIRNLADHWLTQSLVDPSTKPMRPCETEESQSACENGNKDDGIVASLAHKRHCTGLVEPTNCITNMGSRVGQEDRCCKCSIMSRCLTARCGSKHVGRTRSNCTYRVCENDGQTISPTTTQRTSTSGVDETEGSSLHLNFNDLDPHKGEVATPTL